LIAEAGELVEHFQWLSERESEELPRDKLEEIELELADILIYLVRLADKLNIDLVEATRKKLKLNDEKYPADLVHGSAKKYSDY
jgi:NTP pyrophosphatase (non-canonical NTP hydrolase)